jgi:glycosyltransferase involved in cell wall biosynthesis/GT2 family glycosyltransferase
MNIAVVTAAMQSGERGGAEAFYRGLIAALQAAGHHVRELAVPIDESSFEAVLASYGRCYDLDTSAFDLVISTKSPTYMVRHPRHVSYLVHTLRVFYDRFEQEYGGGTDALRQQRRLIHRLDKAALDPSRIERHFSIGRTGYQRLIDADPRWRAIPFVPLHLPPAFDSFRRPRRGEHVFLPGRLHRWKRPDLVVRAFKRVQRDVPLLIAGTGEDEARLRAEAQGDPRIRFLGAVSDRQLLELYARAIAVPFVPIQEDYGLITIEAFRSGKPVITCVDSGEPLEFVKDGVTGFVVEPDERALAERMTFFVDHPDAARTMGAQGRRAVAHLAWAPIVSALTGPREKRASVRRARAPRPAPAIKATVLDMQPIDPAVGGGRLRLLGLYHNLGQQFATNYVGTFDWPGEPPRAHRLSPTLFEVDVPLSGRHFAAVADLQKQAGGRPVIDVSFPRLGQLSTEYVRAAHDAVTGANVVVCSHPWVYPHVRRALDEGEHVLVYDAHNVESVLRYRLLGDSVAGRELVIGATALERELCLRADLVLACSHSERELFHRLYDLPYARCAVVPNGTFVGQAAAAPGRGEARAQLGLGGGPVAVFIGSSYVPNDEAAMFICTSLAAALPEVTFVICGGVGRIVEQLYREGCRPDNVRATGIVDDATRRACLAAADVAINPMFSGQGTNIKMFDFLAAGLPVVSTPVGARGIAETESAMHICAPPEFAGALRQLLYDGERARALGAAGRQLARERYAWERLSPDLGRLLARHWSARRRRPYFSIVVATYERHRQLAELLECLERQTHRDFEIVLVDQSAREWEKHAQPSLDVHYVHTDVKGAVKARNTGAWYARGEVIAFTDDDCRPDRDWLANARRYFENPRVVGVEGLIVSDKVNDPNYRSVTNVGFEGIGFMTANLFIRREVFNALDGLDEQFDHPHFREDTDLGWRASAIGDIPFARDVRVFHPPHLRALDRESHAERVTFFEKDALLFKKHPGRYKSLFLREGHYLHTRGFHEHFARGARKYGVSIDEFLAGVSGGEASA